MTARQDKVALGRTGLFLVSCAFAAILQACPASFAAVVTLAPEGSGASYRWLNVADQAYGAAYRASYDYSHASAQISYGAAGSVFAGTLTASNLKPNFAYQLKLVGTPGTPSNERIGLAGRWWRETWDCSTSTWANGWNLNDKGSGTAPNPNDVVYAATKDTPCASSPTGKLYRYSGYLLMDYFLSDDAGNALLDFQATSSYHVLWKTSQQARGANDGPTKSETFDPNLANPAYDTDWPSATVGIFGEWERLPAGGVFLQPGSYSAQLVLTEESFHGSGGTYAGSWASAMGGDVSFVVAPEPGTVILLGSGLLLASVLLMWHTRPRVCLSASNCQDRRNSRIPTRRDAPHRQQHYSRGL